MLFRHALLSNTTASKQTKISASASYDARVWSDDEGTHVWTCMHIICRSCICLRFPNREEMQEEKEKA